MRYPFCRSCPPSSSAFTLAELMVAILFICIALFGYISLHLRIIHSAFRLEEHEEVRVNLEQFLLKMIVRTRVEDVIDTQELGQSLEGAVLPFEVTKRYTHPVATSTWQVLSADLKWKNDYGEHGLHLESAARKVNWSW